MLDKVDLESKKLPETFCSVPWLQIHTEADGKIMPCCYYSHDDIHTLGNWSTDSLIKTFHSDKWNQLRKDFLDGKKPKACAKCWKEEEHNIRSMRMVFNDRYSNFNDWTFQNNADKFNDIILTNDGSVSSDIKLATVDLIFNNLCNLKCRSCGPGLSSSWAVEVQKQGVMLNSTLLTNKTNSHFELDLESLINMSDKFTEVHFTGGEPLMQEEHYMFLQQLIDAGKTDVKIRYNTNLTTRGIKGYNAFEMLSHFKSVFIVGSIDAMGAEGEYIRHGLDWEDSLNWIREAKETLPDADFGISAVYSVLNSFSAIDLHKFICTNDMFVNRHGQRWGFYLNMCNGPWFMRPTILPIKAKIDLTTKIENHIKWLNETQDSNDFSYQTVLSHWQNAINFLNSVDESAQIPRFYEKMHQIDKFRQESFEKTFPYLDEYMRIYGRT